jgi:chromosome segregation ATPase
MPNRHLLVRRIVTLVGVIAVLALGVGSIRAAAAWTAASAPLTVAPITVSALETDLANERARSDALRVQLRSLDGHARDLERALAQAQSRVESDTAGATDLEDQLAAATAKLAKLEKAIAKAKRDLAARAAAAAAAPRVTTTSTSHEDDDDHEDEEDHDEEDDDD